MPKNLLRIDTGDPRPIWRQIVDGVRQAVATGTLQPGDALPSVRDLARELRVNPNTVARSIQSLVEAGIVETRRGEGTFVASAPASISRREKARQLAEAADRFAAISVTVGASYEECLDELQKALRRLGAEKGPNP